MPLAGSEGAPAPLPFARGVPAPLGKILPGAHPRGQRLLGLLLLRYLLLLRCLMLLRCLLLLGCWKLSSWAWKLSQPARQSSLLRASARHCRNQACFLPDPRTAAHGRTSTVLAARRHSPEVGLAHTPWVPPPLIRGARVALRKWPLPRGTCSAITPREYPRCIVACPCPPGREG